MMRAVIRNPVVRNSWNNSNLFKNLSSTKDRRLIFSSQEGALRRSNLITTKTNFYHSFSSTRKFQRGYSTSPPSSNPSSKYNGRDALNDLNLKWTVPISIILGSGLWFYVKKNPSSEQENPFFRKKVYTHDEDLPPLIDLEEPQTELVIDPSTRIGFPPKLETDQVKTDEPLRLVGLGVRTVSFLSVKVYVAGFYADPRVLRALRVVPGWDTDINKEAFLPPNDNIKSGNNDKSEQENKPIRGEALMRQLLSVPLNFAIRIAPVRQTDFTHLRDGFCRAITGRINSMTKDGTISEFEAEKALESVKTVRSFFPTGFSLPRGSYLNLIRTSGNSLILEYEGKILGELNDQLVSKEIFLLYFSDREPISPMFKESVIEGFCRLYEKNKINNNK